MGDGQLVTHWDQKEESEEQGRSEQPQCAANADQTEGIAKREEQSEKAQQPDGIGKGGSPVLAIGPWNQESCPDESDEQSEMGDAPIAGPGGKGVLRRIH